MWLLLATLTDLRWNQDEISHGVTIIFEREYKYPNRYQNRTDKPTKGWRLSAACVNPMLIYASSCKFSVSRYFKPVSNVAINCEPLSVVASVNNSK